jgi:hypothetical protein
MTGVTLEEIPADDQRMIRMGSGEHYARNTTGRTIPTLHGVGVKAEDGELRIVADLGPVR